MQDFVVNQNCPDIPLPLSQYISIPSLACAKDLCQVLHNISFSSSPLDKKTNSQCISLHYTEGSQIYTIGWYVIYYDINEPITITKFATANLRGISPSYARNSVFASRIHLLRTPISGIGTKLFEHLIHTVKKHNLPSIKISADASSVIFYKKMAERFSNFFVSVETNTLRYMDGGCDFVFRLQQ